MVIKNPLNIINKYKFFIYNKIRGIYLRSSLYNKKISKLENRNLVYKPNPNIFDCLVKYNKKKQNINSYEIKEIWQINNANNSKYKKLHNFFWLFSIDLKSSNNSTQSIINNWIDENIDYDYSSWEIDILSKRIMAWISNSKITYEDGSERYKEKFNFIVRKQINHLKNEINRSDQVDDKLIGCAAIILVGLSYQDEEFTYYGENLLKKILISSIDNEGFPKSRSFRQLVFYLKYLVLIRELFKDSQNIIPDYLNEVIFDLGQSYKLFFYESHNSLLFNGNHITDNKEFDKYLKTRGYNFNCEKNEISGYVYLKNKKNSLIFDAGATPGKQFSESYQSGALSFEFFYLKNKIITNCGYFQKNNHQLNKISKSSATHSSLIIENRSINFFSRNKFGKDITENSFKILDKKVNKEKYKWSIEASHDGYQKDFGVIHKRKLEFDTENLILNGFDKIIYTKNKRPLNFEIRFHLMPDLKVTKTIDGQNILFEVENSGWKLSCENNKIDFETGLYFGNKNKYVENKNIFIYGNTNNENKMIHWILQKI